MRVLAIILIVGSFCVSTVYGQGCSDAGFCTMGAMKPDQNFSRKIDFKLRSAEIVYYRGKSTLSPVIESISADLNFGFNEKTYFQVKLPYQRVTGRLANTSGLSDISISITRNIFHSDKYDVNLTLGTKIPTNNSDIKAPNNLTLPMYYQTSLGSYDIIGGLSLISKEWLFAVGYQQALTSNQNDFTWGEWVRFGDREYLSEHDVGIGLRRGIDLMFRAERNFRYSNYSFNIGILPIYRITSDQGIIRTRENGAKIKTTGLALSALAGFTYHFNVSNSMKFIYGYKFIDRDTNPDGLTRDNVITVAYQVRF